MDTMVRTNRWAETAAFLIGVFGLGFHMIADTLIHLGLRFHCTPVPAPGIPWPIIIGSVALIIPKMIGRAYAGKIILAGIEALTIRLRGRGAAEAIVSAGEQEVARVKVEEPGGTAEMKVPGKDGSE